MQKVQQGTATLADLTTGGATQLSPASSCTPAYPANFPNTGNWMPVLGSNPPSPGVYAVSIPGVHPSSCITWFQANQACRLSGKRLLRNDEWQAGAQGTPDPGTDNGTSDCNISAAADAVNTGSRSNCKSSWGVFDMVGNVDEWVADWALGGACPGWGGFSDDYMCFSGAPGALVRGGDWDDGTGAGVFAVFTVDPSASNSTLLGPPDPDLVIGFRCAR